MRNSTCQCDRDLGLLRDRHASKVFHGLSVTEGEATREGCEGDRREKFEGVCEEFKEAGHEEYKEEEVEGRNIFVKVEDGIGDEDEAE